MRRIQNHSIWLGHAGDLRDPSQLLSNGIEAVIEFADSEPSAILPRELIRCRFPLSDSGDNPPWLIRLAIESVAALIRAGVPTIICCSAGMNRSVCMAAAGIAAVENRSLNELLTEIVESGPADVSPRLFAQVRDSLSR